MNGKCTIFFEDPFWVGVFERTDNDGYSVARYVFGAEPGAAEMQCFAHSQYQNLVFSVPVAQLPEELKSESFKHRLHRVRHESNRQGPGTKAQQAIKAEQERCGLEAKARRLLKSEQDEEQRYRSKQHQRQQKRRGR